MGNYMSEPQANFRKDAHHGTHEDAFQWATINIQGWRKSNEDYIFKRFNLDAHHYIPPPSPKQKRKMKRKRQLAKMEKQQQQAEAAQLRQQILVQALSQSQASGSPKSNTAGLQNNVSQKSLLKKGGEMKNKTKHVRIIEFKEGEELIEMPSKEKDDSGSVGDAQGVAILSTPDSKVAGGSTNFNVEVIDRQMSEVNKSQVLPREITELNLSHNLETQQSRELFLSQMPLPEQDQKDEDSNYEEFEDDFYDEEDDDESDYEDEEEVDSEGSSDSSEEEKPKIDYSMLQKGAKMQIRKEEFRQEDPEIKAQKLNLELIDKSLDSLHNNVTLNMLNVGSALSKNKKSTASLQFGKAFLNQIAGQEPKEEKLPKQVSEPLHSDRFGIKIHRLRDRHMRTSNIRLCLNKRLFVQDNIARHRRMQRRMNPAFQKRKKQSIASSPVRSSNENSVEKTNEKSSTTNIRDSLEIDQKPEKKESDAISRISHSGSTSPRKDDGHQKSVSSMGKKSGKSAVSRDIHSLFSEIESEKPPDRVVNGPFHLFAIIDGHRGHVVADFIYQHLMDVILRNENMMVRKHFAIGLKQVFLKLDEVLNSKPGQAELRDLLGYPESKEGSLFKLPEDPKARANHMNPAWACGAGLTLLVVNSGQIFCACAGDCRAVMATVRGVGKFQVFYQDLSRDHKSGKGAQQDEKLRVVKCGFSIKDNKIVSGPKDEGNLMTEIHHGGPLTRCLGDFRFKTNTKNAPDKQAVIPVPEVRMQDEWKINDWILLGSSGFWEICKNQSKATVENLKKKKFAEIVQKKGITKAADRAQYEFGDTFLRDVLVTMVREGLGQEMVEGTCPPLQENGLVSPGYQNMSAIMIRLKKKPEMKPTSEKKEETEAPKEKKEEGAADKEKEKKEDEEKEVSEVDLDSPDLLDGMADSEDESPNLDARAKGAGSKGKGTGSSGAGRAPSKDQKLAEPKQIKS